MTSTATVDSPADFTADDTLHTHTGFHVSRYLPLQALFPIPPLEPKVGIEYRP